MQFGGFQAGSRADGAIDVGGRAADPADDVVVVIADAGLVTGGASRGLDSADEVGRRERAQRVVHGLARDAAELVVDGAEDRLHVGVGPGADLFEDGEAHCRHASSRGSQELDVILRRRHDGDLTTRSGMSQETGVVPIRTLAAH